MNENLDIRPITKEEISLVKDFPPPSWSLNLEQVYIQHFDQSYFYGAVAVLSKEIAGTGMAVVNSNAAWLGTIIVKEDFRRKGIGNAITSHLVNYTKSSGVESIILTASADGLPIYEKMGFNHDLCYVFYIPTSPQASWERNTDIYPINMEDIEEIIQLDYDFTGEDRKALLKNVLMPGFKYKNKDIEGYYLPHCGKGFIAASSGKVGIELLKLRLSLDSSPVCLPETNEAGINFLQSLGFKEYMKIPRMFLGKNVHWQSEAIFSRGSGYLG